MRINTFIVLLLVTFIICNSTQNIKGTENNMLRKLSETCKTELDEPVDTYKEITGITDDKSFFNINFIVYVDMTTGISTSAHKYTYYSYSNKLPQGTIVGQFKFTTVAKIEYTLTNDVISAVHNYGFPWTTGGTDIKEGFSFGSVAGGAYAADCTTASGGRMVNLLASPDATTLAKYEKIDQYMVSYPEPRNDITDEVIGQGIKLNWVDSTNKINYNMLLTKSQFCHYSCTVGTVDNPAKCNLLVYPKSKYNSNTINQASIITVDGSAKIFEEVKADTTAANVKDKCSDQSKPAECTAPQYTIMSKGENKVLTGYFKDVQNKYLVSTAESPEMPADIKAKFPEYTYCFEIPKVQGVSNMFINSILLILIVILMI